MKDLAYYSNTGPYPDKPMKPGRPGISASPAYLRIHADAVEKYEKDMVEYRKLEEAYRRKVADLEAEFRKDLLEEFGLTNHPKADKIYSYVWDKGHSSGYGEMYNIMSDLADLFAD